MNMDPGTKTTTKFEIEEEITDDVDTDGDTGFGLIRNGEVAFNQMSSRMNRIKFIRAMSFKSNWDIPPEMSMTSNTASTASTYTVDHDTENDAKEENEGVKHKNDYL